MLLRQRPADQELHRQVVHLLGFFRSCVRLVSQPSLGEQVAEGAGDRLEPLPLVGLPQRDDVGRRREVPVVLRRDRRLPELSLSIASGDRQDRSGRRVAARQEGGAWHAIFDSRHHRSPMPGRQSTFYLRFWNRHRDARPLRRRGSRFGNGIVGMRFRFDDRILLRSCVSPVTGSIAVLFPGIRHRHGAAPIGRRRRRPGRRPAKLPRIPPKGPAEDAGGVRRPLWPGFPSSWSPPSRCCAARWPWTSTRTAGSTSSSSPSTTSTPARSRTASGCVRLLEDTDGDGVRQEHGLRRRPAIGLRRRLLGRRRLRRLAARYPLLQGHRRRRQGRRAPAWSSPASAATAPARRCSTRSAGASTTAFTSRPAWRRRRPPRRGRQARQAGLGPRPGLPLRPACARRSS